MESAPCGRRGGASRTLRLSGTSAARSVSDLQVRHAQRKGGYGGKPFLGEGRLRRETVEGFPLFVEHRAPSRRRAVRRGGEARASRRAPPLQVDSEFLGDGVHVIVPSIVKDD